MIERYKDYSSLKCKGEKERIVLAYMLSEIVYNFCYYGKQLIFYKVTKPSLISYLITFFRNVVSPSDEELKDQEALNNQRILFIKTIDTLLDVKNKDMKPIQIIKNISPDFIVSL